VAVQEVEPGVFTAVFARVGAAGVNNARLALLPLALVIEKQAKINASTGAHRYGTPSPASPGTGPAVVSGNLRRSITHAPITKTLDGWETRVGTAAGFYPPYPRKSRGGGPAKRTPANRYGFYLETGLKNGTAFPFLKPAADFGASTAAPIIYAAMYGADWTRIT
jgi:hypothetical protein